ncbi:hypothetical protein N7488_004485 [Penicillium malachiteum]|nr:hypothetical protein N7488_004485 [Penicillium malachiteum]
MAKPQALTRQDNRPTSASSFMGRYDCRSFDYKVPGHERQNDFGEYISYRTAKAALNMETVTIAHELKAKSLNITVLALDPGHVPTRLSRWEGTTEMEASIQGMVKIIEEAEADLSGSYLRWNGDKIPL